MVTLFVPEQLGGTAHRRRSLREARAAPRQEGLMRAHDDVGQLRRRRLVVRRDKLAGGGVGGLDAHAAILHHRSGAIFPDLAVPQQEPAMAEVMRTTSLGYDGLPLAR